MSQYGNPPDPNQPEQQPGQPASDPYGAAPPPPDPYAAPPPNPYGTPPPVNPYGAPPPANPYGDATTNPYGTAPANPYGAGPANPYGQGPAVAATGYASWISRVGATLIDGLLGLVASAPLIIGYVMVFSGATTTTDAQGVDHLHVHPSGASVALIWLGLLTSLAFWIWNVCIRQGRTGATVGKGLLAIRLVNYEGRPIGAGMSFLRQIVHVLDSLACYVGWLWPLWDAKSQTFADKIMNTVVVNATQPQQGV
jgi:uncharacterized RDD family membrane protein YckC